MLKTHVISAIPFPERITRYTSPKEGWEFLTWVWLPEERAAWPVPRAPGRADRQGWRAGPAALPSSSLSPALLLHSVFRTH